MVKIDEQQKEKSLRWMEEGFLYRQEEVRKINLHFDLDAGVQGQNL